MLKNPKTNHPYFVLVKVHELLGPCPVFKEGDTILIDEPNVILSETDAICTRALPVMTSFFMTLAEEGKPTGATVKPFLSRCQATGSPNGPVIFELKTLPRAEV